MTDEQLTRVWVVLVRDEDDEKQLDAVYADESSANAAVEAWERLRPRCTAWKEQHCVN